MYVEACILQDKVDVVVSCLASRTGGLKDSWDIDYQVRACSVIKTAPDPRSHAQHCGIDLLSVRISPLRGAASEAKVRRFRYVTIAQGVCMHA